MQGSFQDYMRTGIIHFMAYPKCASGEGPILDTLSGLLCDDFFEVVEVTHIKDADTRRQARSLAEQARVELCFGAQPILLAGKLDLNHPDEEERQRAVNAVLDTIPQAEELGCRAVAVLSGKVSEDREAAKARLIDSLQQLARCARPKGISIVLEQFDQVDFGKNCLIGPTAEAVEISQEMRRDFPNFGLLLDLSHLPLLHETPETAIRTAGEHLVHAHIGNCAMDDPTHEAYGDNHPRFGAPGTRNDVPELVRYLKALMDIGFISEKSRGIVSFEVKPMSRESSEAVIAGSKRTLLAAWRRL